MAKNTLVIEVGGDRERIDIELVQPGVLKVRCSKCYAEFMRRMKCGPMPQLKDATNFVDKDWSKGLCLYRPNASKPGIPQLFPEDIYNQIVAHLNGESVTITPEPSVKPETEAQALARRVAALEAKATPLTHMVDTAEPVPPRSAPVAAVGGEDEPEDVRACPQVQPLSAKELEALSVKEREVVSRLLNGDTMEHAAEMAGYKNPERQAKRLAKIPVLAQIIEDMETAE